MHLFTCNEFSGTAIKSEDCDEGDLEWVDIDKVCSLPLWEGDKLFLDLLAKDAPFFSMKLAYVGNELVFASVDGKTVLQKN